MDETCRRAWVVVALGAAAAGCTPPTETPVAEDAIQSMAADNVLFGMTSYLTASGVREGVVRADTAYMFADSSVALLRKMEIVFYDPQGVETATVTGTRGRLHLETEEMTAQGDVVLLIRSDGSKLESQEIHYNPQLDRIWSDSATVRTMADGTVTSGSSFESDIAFENVTVRDVRGGARQIF